MALFWSLCHFCTCCRGWLSWKELDLLCIWVFVLYHLCVQIENWGLEMNMFWSFHALVLACDRLGSWKRVLNWLILLFLPLLGSELLLFYWLCLAIDLSDLGQVIGFDNFYTGHGFCIVLHSTCMRPSLTLTGCPMMISSRVGVSTTKNWWSWNEFFAVVLESQCDCSMIHQLAVVVALECCLWSFEETVCGVAVII